MKAIKQHAEQLALSGILVLAGFLSLYNIGNQGYSNEFYAACVKSMTLSLKNFFFVSLDPGGWVTVDKPPVSLWAQAVFCKIFGFHTWSFLLPEALAAMAAIFILYRTVKRHFGGVAGLVSALALALSPIFIVVSKTNNTDSVLILFMVLAAWAMSVAAEKGRLRWLVLSAALLGVAYNAKTLEAFLILPALFAVYLFGTKIKWRKRAWHLAVAAAVLAAVSLSWSLAVDLTPASERPYVDNSTTNSELELAIGYNGIQRITGQNRGSSARITFTSSDDKSASGASGGTKSGASSSASADATSGATMNAGAPGGNGGTSAGTGTAGTNSAGAASSAGASASGSSGTSSRGSSSSGSGSDGGNPFNVGGMGGLMNGGFRDGGGGGGGNMSFSGGGSASPLRMFNTTLGGQDSWLLPFGLFAMLALLLRALRARDREERRKLLRGLLLWGVSVLTMAAYFSVAGFFHPYYISAMCPFLAALVGIGITEMWKLYREERLLGFLLPLAFLATLAVQILMLRSYPAYAKILVPLAGVATGAPALALAVLKPMGKGNGRAGAALAGIALAGLLVSPAVWLGYSVFRSSFNAQIPSAGPSASETSFGRGGFGGSRDFGGGRFDRDSQSGGTSGSGFGASGASGNSDSSSGNSSGGGSGSASSMPSGGASGSSGQSGSSGSGSALASFLLKNNTGEKWLVAVPSASEAESIILSTGKPVMAIGGFSGNDNTLTVAKLEELVKSGQLKYFMVSGEGRGVSGEITAWVEKYGTAVDSSKYGGSTGGMSSGTLYDLSGYKTAASASAASSK